MIPTSPQDDPEFSPDWGARQQYWQRKLGRVRLGAEPVEVQLAKYRRATALLATVTLGIAVLFLALFSVFWRPDVGLVFVSIVLLPTVLLAWLDYAILRVRAMRYLREREAFKRKQTDPGRT